MSREKKAAEARHALPLRLDCERFGSPKAKWIFQEEVEQP
jgi:hypothetical protein